MHSISLLAKFYRHMRPAAVVAAIVLAAAIPAAQAVPAGAFPDKYAAIVVDAATGRTLFSEKADMRRYPASLTKMMTLYLLFDTMKAGRISARTPIPISAYANGQPPTKLNLGAGQRIDAESAAKAIITKSANDIAVAIAEFLGGSEQNFARMMTLKARQLGMRNTNFANASGLPNLRNYSTARDLAILALALRRNFPQQYALFKTTGFAYRGRFIRGHNRLVATMAGVDGLKTGYTRMSGFNLASSRHMGNKTIVAIVMGGKTSALRDSHMAGLLTRYMDKARGGRGLSIMPPEAPAAPVLMASAKRRLAAPAAAATLARLASANIPVPTAKIVMDAAAAVPESADVLLAQGAAEAEGSDVAVPAPSDSAPMSDRERDSAMLMMLASQPADDIGGQAALRAVADAAPEEENSGDKQALDRVMTASLPQAAGAVKKAPRHLLPHKRKKGWIIQVAAGRNAHEAERIMHKTTHAVRRHNAEATPYTEKFVRRRAVYYRVRFGGFASKAAARASCAKLKKLGYKCIALAP